MTENYRGGNGRLLTKTLDLLGNPVAILDRQGSIVFVNAALCRLVQADATLLVGQQCSWQTAPDNSPFAALLTSLAPPTSALQGRIVSRQLTTPIVFGSVHTGQLFIPMLHEDGSVECTLVVLGSWEEINSQLPTSDGPAAQHSRQWESVIVDIRSRWQWLDGLHPLMGTSPAIVLAMTRAQLAGAQGCSVVVTGPPGSGKADIVRGIFATRLKRQGLNKLAGQFFPVNCRLLQSDLLQQMLEVLTGRFNHDLLPEGQLVLFEQLDQLDQAGAEYLDGWLKSHAGRCSLAATSDLSCDHLSRRSPVWHSLVSQLATVEIDVPPLRERREDIPILATQLLAANCLQKGRAVLTLAAETIHWLTGFSWPENLRQLTQAIDEAVNHAVLVSSIQPQHLPVVVRAFASTTLRSESNSRTSAGTEPPAIATREVESINLDEVLMEVERTMLMRALKLSPRNRAQAARMLGISRARLLRRLEQLGINSA